MYVSHNKNLSRYKYQSIHMGKIWVQYTFNDNWLVEIKQTYEFCWLDFGLTFGIVYL